ncbi:MAG: hypothetical protein P8X57_04520 [Cyclobacteriaceae bacterium]
MGIKHSAGILLGLLAALTILLSQSFYYTLETVAEKAAVESHADDGSGDMEEVDLLSSANDMVSSIAQLSLEDVKAFIIDIPLIVEVDLSDLIEETIDFDDLFRTLFRQIISPNAP